MMKIRSVLISLVAAGLALLGGTGSGHTADYPVKPVRIVVPFPPGATPDTMARLVGANLAPRWGQQVLVENRLGAGGIVAYASIPKATPDGYTLLLAASGIAVVGSLFDNLTFDTLRDFTPITLVSSATHVLVVNSSVPAHSVNELIALAKAKPGQLAFGSSGSGTVLHLAGELFKVQTGAGIVHVPYKGAALAITDLLGGRIAMMFIDIAPALPHLKGPGAKLRALGVTTRNRSPALPEVPAIAEAAAAAAGFDMVSWFALLGPAGVPKDIVDKIARDVASILSDPQLRAANRAQGVELVGNTPAEFAAFLKSQVTLMAKVVKASGARPDR